MAAIETPQAMQDFLGEHFPELETNFPGIAVEKVAPRAVTLKVATDERHLRPGGTVSGPVLFAIADVAGWLSILSAIGPEALTVTTNLNINFLKKPRPGTILAQGSVLKLGKRLAVTQVSILEASSEDLLAHATATYSIPPR